MEKKNKVYSYIVSENVAGNMRINITQTKQNFGIEYEIVENGYLLYKGYDNFWEKHLPIRMEDGSGKIIFKHSLGLAKPDNLKNGNGEIVGGIYWVNYHSARYYCVVYNNELLEIYMWSTGRTPHLSVFLNCKQIAQIESENVVSNYLDKYVLYLLSEYRAYKEILCFFTMVYDKYVHGNHGEAFYGAKTEVSYGYSIKGIGMDKYFPDFMRKNFPDVEIIAEKVTVENLKEGWEISKKQTFTQKKFKKGLKFGIPLCLLVALFCSVAVSLVSNIFFGIIVFIFVAIVESFFVFIMWFICKVAEKTNI